MTPQPDLRVYFGDLEVSDGVSRFKTTTAIDALSSAEFTLDLAAIPDRPVDFRAEVRMEALYQGVANPLFTGVVEEADPTGDEVAVRCVGGLELTEHLVPPFIAKDLRGVEIIYLTLRSVGWPEDRMQLDGLDELPFEPFKVIVPVFGVDLPDTVSLAEVQIVRPEALSDVLADMEPSRDDARGRSAFDELRTPFETAGAYAVAFESAARGFDAEAAALRSIDVALAWLAARARYGLARLPSSEPAPFSREVARALPERGTVVLVRGLDTGRRWLRVPGSGIAGTTFPLGDPSRLQPSLLAGLTTQDQQALMACRRAATDSEPLARVTALWDAIEFYAAQTSVPELFSSSQLAALSRTLPSDLSVAQKARAAELIGQLNSPPLATRLRAALDLDGVPVADGEFDLLRRLRRLRNDAVHGRSIASPTREDLEHATSVVSRMLVYRIHRRQGGAPQQ